MTTGLHSVNLANPYLNVLSGTNITAPANVYMKLHTGDPGSAGTSAASANTARVVIAWAAASGGSKAANGTLPSWASWLSGVETISHISVWDDLTAGSVRYTGVLTASKPMTNGDTLTITTHTVAFTPVMA